MYGEPQKGSEMERRPRKIYTFTIKMEAVRLVVSGKRVTEAARILGVHEQTLSNWIKAHKAGKLMPNGRGSKLTAEQIEIRNLRAELARVKMERSILSTTTTSFLRGQR
jgi:transposase